MNRLIFILAMILALPFVVKSQDKLPQVISGKIVRIENFHSKYVTSRNIDIWLPEGYSNSKKYEVLYMHDGQMLFDPEQSWNRQAWDVDDAATSLFAGNKIRPFIVVGIWNGGKTRHSDYFPQKPFEKMTRTEKDSLTTQLQRSGRTTEAFKPQSDNYLKFIVRELKPYVDRNYSVYTSRESTFIMGSSMGGLISLYAICKYPALFGGAACLSTHWTGSFTAENNAFPDAMLHYLSKKLPDPGTHKIYFDCGDQTLDALYPAIQEKVDNLMRQKGYDKENWLTKYFTGDDHSEKSWSKRVHIPLEFLFGK